MSERRHFLVDLSGKVALVTGASRGIGLAIFDALCASGARVMGTATTPAGVAQLSQRIHDKQQMAAAALLDVCDPASVAALFAELQQTIGLPSIVVNNAGVTRDNLLLRLKDDDWRSVIETNLTGVYRVSKACLKGMLKQRWGRIVNVGSVVGSFPSAGQVNYAAAKAGLEGFSRSLAQEVGARGITVNTVAPGFIETDMTKSLPPAHVSQLKSQVVVGRLGAPEEIADAVTFLVSDAASYITGQVLHINGGLYMH